MKDFGNEVCGRRSSRILRRKLQSHVKDPAFKRSLFYYQYTFFDDGPGPSSVKSTTSISFSSLSTTRNPAGGDFRMACTSLWILRMAAEERDYVC